MDVALEVTGIWKIEGVNAKTAGNNCGVRFREANLRGVYRVVEYGGIHQVPQVVVPRTRNHTGGEEGRVKEK